MSGQLHVPASLSQQGFLVPAGKEANGIVAYEKYSGLCRESNDSLSAPVLN
jgi:hypothetical protein